MKAITFVFSVFLLLPIGITVSSSIVPSFMDPFLRSLQTATKNKQCMKPGEKLTKQYYEILVALTSTPMATCTTNEAQEIAEKINDAIDEALSTLINVVETQNQICTNPIRRLQKQLHSKGMEKAIPKSETYAQGRSRELYSFNFMYRGAGRCNLCTRDNQDKRRRLLQSNNDQPRYDDWWYDDWWYGGGGGDDDDNDDDDDDDNDNFHEIMPTAKPTKAPTRRKRKTRSPRRSLKPTTKKTIFLPRTKVPSRTTQPTEWFMSKRPTKFRGRTKQPTRTPSHKKKRKTRPPMKAKTRRPIYLQTKSPMKKTNKTKRPTPLSTVLVKTRKPTRKKKQSDEQPRKSPDVKPQSPTPFPKKAISKKPSKTKQPISTKGTMEVEQNTKQPTTTKQLLNKAAQQPQENTTNSLTTTVPATFMPTAEKPSMMKVEQQQPYTLHDSKTAGKDRAIPSGSTPNPTPTENFTLNNSIANMTMSKGASNASINSSVVSMKLSSTNSLTGNATNTRTNETATQDPTTTLSNEILGLENGSSLNINRTGEINNDDSVTLSDGIMYAVSFDNFDKIGNSRGWNATRTTVGASTYSDFFDASLGPMEGGDQMSKSFYIFRNVTKISFTLSFTELGLKKKEKSLLEMGGIIFYLNGFELDPSILMSSPNTTTVNDDDIPIDDFVKPMYGETPIGITWHSNLQTNFPQEGELPLRDQDMTISIPSMMYALSRTLDVKILFRKGFPGRKIAIYSAWVSGYEINYNAIKIDDFKFFKMIGEPRIESFIRSKVGNAFYMKQGHCLYHKRVKAKVTLKEREIFDKNDFEC